MTDIENLVLKINRITILKSQAAGPAVDWLHLQELMHEGCKACAQPVLAPKFPYQKLTACTTLPCTDMKHHPSKVWPPSQGISWTEAVHDLSSQDRWHRSR